MDDWFVKWRSLPAVSFRPSSEKLHLLDNDLGFLSGYLITVFVLARTQVALDIQPGPLAYVFLFRARDTSSRDLTRHIQVK